MNKKNIWIVLSLILLLGNLCFSFYLWKKTSCRPRQAKEMKAPRDFLMNELQMNDDQQKKYNQLADDHFSKKEGLVEKERNAMLDLFSLLKNDSIDADIVAEKIAAASKIKMSIDSLIFYHFKEVKKLCNKDQLGKIDDLLRKGIMRPGEGRPGDKMNPPPPPERP